MNDDEVFCAVLGQVTKIGEGFVEVACREGKLRRDLIHSMRKRLY